MNSKGPSCLNGALIINELPCQRRHRALKWSNFNDECAHYKKESQNVGHHGKSCSRNPVLEYIAGNEPGQGRSYLLES